MVSNQNPFLFLIITYERRLHSESRDERSDAHPMGVGTRILTIPVEPSWLLRPTHLACQRLLPVAGISCHNPAPGSGAPALHTARLSVFSGPLSPASPPPYRRDSRRLQ